MTTCLLISIEQGNHEMMRIFLENGANPDGTEDAVIFQFQCPLILSQAITPLMLALEAKDIKAATILLSEYKADPNKSVSNLSPLHVVVKVRYFTRYSAQNFRRMSTPN